MDIRIVLCWMLLVGRNNVQSINQTSAPQLVLQGAPVVLECTYTATGYLYLYWYVQHPGKAPLLLVNSIGQKEHNGFSAEHIQKNASFHMEKAQAELTDSGLYSCAMSDTVNKSSLHPSQN
ncbi:hypothetical protein GDO78_013820, partial [Eleutherodactylus coqui]